MAAYVIADVDITDPEPYQEYQRRVLATVEAYGGRFLIRGGRHETLEGEWRPHRIVVLEFATLEQAKVWYHSPEYQEILPIRERHARTKLILVEGV